MGQQTLSGAFTLSDPLSAYAYLNFVPVLIQLQTENTHEWLQLNSTRSVTLKADSRDAAGLSATRARAWPSSLLLAAH